MKFKNQLALVIATKDRPTQVRALLAGLRSQTFVPKQIVVVDGSDDPIEDVVAEMEDLPIDYITVRPPALTKQKNAGVAALLPEIGLVAFVDDDIEFESNSFEAMMEFWDHADDNLGGASFNLTDFNYSDSRLGKLSKRLFFIDNDDFGQVRRSGFNTHIWDAPETRLTRWLSGGCTVWRREVFDLWKFDEWFAGSGLWEDVHFSHQVAKKYELAVVANARATHREGPVAQSAQVRLGKTQIINWVYFVRHNQDLSLAMCLWACVGRTAINLAKGLATREPGLILRSLGNSMGLTAVLLGALNPMPSKEARN